MRASVITICHNAAQELGETLKSVGDQTYRNLEHVIIDGGSKDGTTDLLRTVSKETLVVSEPDGGIYDAMNKGLALATGDVIVFLNAGDHFFSDYSVELAMQFMQDEPDVDVAYGGIEIRYQDGRTSTFIPDVTDNQLDFLITQSLPHQATFAKRRAFGMSGLFDRKYRTHADYDWFLRVAADPRIRLRRMPVMIASFALGGASSQIERGERERHVIQNKLPIYWRPDWIRRRIEAYQELYISLRLAIEHPSRTA